MYLKFLGVIATAFILSACASNDPSSSGSTAGGANTDNGGINPQSQEHIVRNYGDVVLFGYDRYDLSPKTRAVIEGWATYAEEFPQTEFTIEGHADERGTREYNLALGERRANATKEYLSALGIASDRLSTVSFGKEQPAVMGSSEEAYAQNRRGVLVLN